ncbi:recombinase family protein [Halococcus sp. PRR34]|uniref:recombinase family protein n=1 Tax=Halococcus sp. PRR34 TaxID=3020830 RepID=UPI002361D931|nr:recombinase family protein [Halococcus sp. PRR34]
MARYATYIRASTDDQETSHQRDAINEWLSQHEVDPSEIDRYIDLAQSGADPGREQFTELVDAIQSESYEYVVVWEISRLARLGSISQRFFEHCEDAGTTVAITDGWVEEVRPDGTGKLIADISAAVAEEERRRLTKRIESGVSRAQREGKWLGRVPKGFRRDSEGYLQLIHEADRDAGEISYLEMRSAIERVDAGESYRSVAADTPNIGRSTIMSIDKNEDRRAWYLDAEAEDRRVEQVLANATH